MKLKELENLVAKGESDTLEFKTSTTQLKPAFETICAFLNAKGGTVLIGVKNNGQIIGQDISDNTKLEIANEIKKIEPNAPIETHYIQIRDNKYVISVKVYPGDHVPYVYDGRAFQRNESQTDRMSQHRYEQLLVKRGQLNHSWEEMTASEYRIDDLDHEEIYKTISDGIQMNRIPASAQKEDVVQILERLGLMVENELKRAAIVLYVNQDAMRFTQCMLKMARFKGTDKLGDFIDNQQIYGNAFKIFSEADIFLRRHLPISSVFNSNQFKRIDKPAIPILAVREAVINAICHRDYSDLSTDISLAIYDDRLEIWNSGSLLRNLTIENLKHKHESILRNKLIANTFYVRGLIEKWGSGTNKMINLCKQEDIPEPIFMEHSGGIAVSFSFKNIISNNDELKKLSLTSRQIEILELLRKSPLNAKQISEKLNDSPSVRTIQIDLSHLEKAGLVKREGRARAVIWRYVKK